MEACESGHLKKTASFMAAFAYKQHKWALLLHIANNNSGDPVIEQFKLLTLIELECYDELIECISSWSTHENFKISKDVVCSTPSNYNKLTAEFVFSLIFGYS